MKVLVTGRGGQLAWELEQTTPDGIEFVSFDAIALDITDFGRVNQVLMAESPDIVINAAAYTAVDKAETEQQAAYAVNEVGSQHLAIACKNINAKLIHVSTDFVFDGTKTMPYQTDDTPNPINVYGASKLAGEIKVNNILGNQATIIRTAWVYSANGNNFVKTMLRLMAEREKLGIVYDQVGTPTWAKGLAKMIWGLIELNKTNPENKAQLLHWTDAGVASWFDFAVAIQELGIEKGLLTRAIPLSAIPAANYPAPAARPSFSVIDKVTAEAACGISTVHWRKQLCKMLDEYIANQSH
ncbi:dTDP-4-dehydrorhamnose reductase [Shewanella youngdeokensis]|uniref:dTDP-4-dehydrorhamnose reductase n=1 Tax=Shewanella youngdeokensis TaxID=2999068 RepID=A0ABZ0K371_9GAMM|nr:dTDP-4-dehydrorhamnose reductase [Shewanella sp. DAU334]